MKVKELIVMLEKLDENLDLVCMTRDEAFLEDHQSYRVLEINSVDLAKAKLIAPAKALPTVKLRQTSTAVAQQQVVIEMTCANTSSKSQYTYERRTGVDRRNPTRSSGSSFSHRVN